MYDSSQSFACVNPLELTIHIAPKTKKKIVQLRISTLEEQNLHIVSTISSLLHCRLSPFKNLKKYGLAIQKHSEKLQFFQDF